MLACNADYGLPCALLRCMASKSETKWEQGALDAMGWLVQAVGVALTWLIGAASNAMDSLEDA